MEAYPYAAPVPRAVKVAPTPVADLEARQNFNNPTEASILSVLVTAVPASILELAVTNPPEMYSLLISDFGDGTFPAWYTSLDSDVQCYLTEGTICASSQLFPSSTRVTGPTSSANEGLSTGAKAGIGVGVALGVLLLISGAVGCCLWMRRRKKNKVRKASQIPGGVPAAAAMQQQQQQHQGQKYEAVPQTGGGYYAKNDGYVQQPGQPVQQAPSPVSSYGAGYAPSPGAGYEYNAGYGGQQQQYGGGQQYPPPQQGYAQGQPYQQHPPPQQVPIPQQRQQPIPQQQQGPQAQELPTAAVSRPHELS